MSRVYIGNLPPRCSEREVERFFRSYGRLRDIFLKGLYGFVEFRDRRDAEDAVYDLNGKDLGGSRVVVEHARLPANSRRDRRRERSYRERSRNTAPIRTKYRVVVTNLSSRVSWQDLKDLFKKVGDVTYADAHHRRNEGIVEFTCSSDMRASVDKFDGYELNGRRLKVRLDKDDSRHSRSRTRSRSRSRSRSHRRKKRSSRSRSRSRDSGKRRRDSHSRSNESRSRSRSDRRKSDRSRSRSKSGESGSDRDKKSQSKEKSKEKKSRSHSRSRSRSDSAHKENADASGDHEENNHDDCNDKKDRTKSKSRSMSRSRSRSKSRSKSRSASRSRSRSSHGSERNGHSDQEQDMSYNDDE